MFNEYRAKPFVNHKDRHNSLSVSLSLSFSITYLHIRAPPPTRPTNRLVTTNYRQRDETRKEIENLVGFALS